MLCLPRYLYGKVQVVCAGWGGQHVSGAVFFLTSMRDGDASFVVPLMYSTLLFASVLDYWAGLPGDW